MEYKVKFPSLSAILFHFKHTLSKELYQKFNLFSLSNLGIKREQYIYDFKMKTNFNLNSMYFHLLRKG